MSCQETVNPIAESIGPFQFLLPSCPSLPSYRSLFLPPLPPRIPVHILTTSSLSPFEHFNPKPNPVSQAPNFHSSYVLSGDNTTV